MSTLSASDDTIAAIATATGKGGVGIIRISGQNIVAVSNALFSKTLTPRHAYYLDFQNLDKTALIDQGIAIYYQGPNSYTGEDVIELQGHGGVAVLNLLLKEILKIEGVRLAQPGEFTLRAFLNNKIDLAQAEAIADIIESSSEQAVKAAANSLSGEFSNLIQQLLTKLIDARLYLEAALDFPEEEIDFLADKALQDKIQNLQNQLSLITQQARQGKLLKEGLSVVILGQPNAGKSSLLNKLTGEASAIVTDIAGTTRDVLREHIHIDGLPLHIIDTAGLRTSGDSIEQEGIKRAWQEVEKADRVLLLVDANKGITEFEQNILQQINAKKPVDIIFNKIDLGEQDAKVLDIESKIEIYLSAKTGEGINLLREHLKQSIGFKQTSEGQFIARQRHIDALSKIDTHIKIAIQQFENRVGELAAEELRLAQQQLSTITGEFHSDDLLGEIFAGFCIGK